MILFKNSKRMLKTVAFLCMYYIYYIIYYILLFSKSLNINSITYYIIMTFPLYEEREKSIYIEGKRKKVNSFFFHFYVI